MAQRQHTCATGLQEHLETAVPGTAVLQEPGSVSRILAAARVCLQGMTLGICSAGNDAGTVTSGSVSNSNNGAVSQKTTVTTPVGPEGLWTALEDATLEGLGFWGTLGGFWEDAIADLAVRPTSSCCMCCAARAF